MPEAPELRRVYRSLRDADGLVEPDELAELAPERDVRVLVGMLEQAGLVERGFDEGRRMRVAVPQPPVDAGERVDALLARARLVAESRAEVMISFAESARCRHSQVAAHFGEALEPPCGTCDVCAPQTTAFAVPVDIVSPLPEDVGAAIVDVVADLRWPLGRRSLVAMLRGSVSAPRSARTSHSFGILAAATDADVRRWVGVLEQAGALVERTTPDGYRVLGADRSVTPQRIAAAGGNDSDVDVAHFERLRSWRSERARADGVPAYVVFPDATLRTIVSTQPGSLAELATVKGVGPAKLERYGEAVLAALASS